MTNFNLAFGIHKLNSMYSNEWTIDYTGYLEVSLLKVDAKVTTTTESGLPSVQALQLRNCSMDDFENFFNKPIAGQEDFVERWFNKGLLCHDDLENFDLQGQFGLRPAKLL